MHALASPAPAAAVPLTKRGHPRGLSTLFFTEMWERLGYYGMRALLLLFMVDATRQGGLGLSVPVAAAIYGLYTAAVYLAALPGGWVADRLLGARRAVWCGGISIAAGYFTLAVPAVKSFYLGLGLVVIGSGLLKPNMSAMVGQLYPEGGARRDAGFTLFYMGVNLGAALGPLICSTLGERLNWRYGFAAAGVGMALGLVQYGITGRHLGDIGRPPAQRGPRAHRDWLILGVCLSAVVLAGGLCLAGLVHIDPLQLARRTATVILAIAVVYFAGAFLLFGLDKAEKRRLVVILVLFLASALFWAGFEQAGSSFNLFAGHHTQRVVSLAALGVTGARPFEIPAGWFQSLGAIFVIAFAPLMAALWITLARRRLDPSPPAKFAFGLILLAAGFLVIAAASTFAARGQKVGVLWLVTTYFLHSIGELCLSPVGLSSVTKLAPPRLVGQMMGIWFLATSLGNLIAGLIAGTFKAEAAHLMPGRYTAICLSAAGCGVVLLLLARPIKRLIGASGSESV